MSTEQQVRTPALVVDGDRLRRNIGRLARHAADRGVALRPHVKTHKCPEIARLQLGAGAAGLTVATIGEAEVFVGAGCRDVFVAYPLVLDQDAASRVRALLPGTTLGVGLDSVTSAAAMADHLAADRGRVRVLVEIDSGHHRTGVPPDRAGELAVAARDLGLAVHGVFTFPGHGYAPDQPGPAARQEAEALQAAADSLRSRGIEPAVVSGGSTPTARAGVRGPATELRPGVYVFGDAQQLELGTMDPSEIALWATSTVVSHAHGNVVLDAGSKCLGADRAPWATGFGRVLEVPDARIVQLSEHHAVVTWPSAEPVPPIGSRVRVVPNHVCNAVNLADVLHVVEQGTVAATWAVAARGCG